MQRKAARFETVHIPIGDFASDGENISEFSTASSKTDKQEAAVGLPKIRTSRPRSPSAKKATKYVHFIALEDKVAASGVDKSKAYLHLPPLSPTQENYPLERRNSNGNVRMGKSPVPNSVASREEKSGFKVSALLQEHIHALKKAQTALIKEARAAILEARMKEREEKLLAESKKRARVSRRIAKSQTSFDSSKSDEVFDMNGRKNQEAAHFEVRARTNTMTSQTSNFTQFSLSPEAENDAKHFRLDQEKESRGEENNKSSSDKTNGDLNEDVPSNQPNDGKDNSTGQRGGHTNQDVYDASNNEMKVARRGSKLHRKAEGSLMERFRVPRDTKSLLEELRKLGKTEEAASLKELLESQELAEKEMRKAQKKEKILEKEEQKKREKEEHDRKRRETHYQKMEELAKEEAEKRETVMKMKETKKLQSLKRQKKNLLLWNEIQTSILSTRTTRAYKFSYYPPMPYKPALPVPHSPTQSPELSVSTASGCSSPADSISSLEFASNLKDLDRNGSTNEREE